jgi:hypothetical protein
MTYNAPYASRALDGDDWDDDFDPDSLSKLRDLLTRPTIFDAQPCGRCDQEGTVANGHTDPDRDRACTFVPASPR